MNETPRFIEHPEGQSTEPELIDFLSLRPDESLRIVRIQPTEPGIPTRVELIKLETPLGGDETNVSMSGYKTINADIVEQSISYLKELDPKYFSKIEAIRLFEVLVQVIEIRDQLR